MTLRNFDIITDSSSDLPLELYKKLNVPVVPLSVLIDGKIYKDYPDEKEIKRKDFYALLREKKIAKTSAPSILDFYTEFEKAFKSGKDVLYIGFSSALSSTFANAKIAANDLKELYPENKILLVDSLCASLGQGSLVYYAVKKKEHGASLEETFNFVEKEKLHICHWFTVGDLKYLQRGGRISKAAAIAGTMLSVKPIMHVDNDGKLVKVYIVRGRNKAIEELAIKVKETKSENGAENIFIVHGDCYNDALTLKEILTKYLGPKKFYINNVGPVIGAHSGPGTLAVFFIGSVR